ncbi:hypothetical protein J2772_004392 [Chryseobacterium jejuense]|nr:hypothetical protein [Chryseobacterium jejuense]
MYLKDPLKTDIINTLYANSLPKKLNRDLDIKKPDYINNPVIIFVLKAKR